MQVAPKREEFPVENTSLMDWINSFDDPYCVLVSSLPEDLLNGVVLSHIVGFIACSLSDRAKIFDLLNYPDQQDFKNNLNSD